mgnify:CR=1 FL=1
MIFWQADRVWRAQIVSAMMYLAVSAGIPVEVVWSREDGILTSEWQLERSACSGKVSSESTTIPECPEPPRLAVRLALLGRWIFEKQNSSET